MDVYLVVVTKDKAYSAGVGCTRMCSKHLLLLLCR